MNFWSNTAKVFAVGFLLFVNFSIISAQDSIYQLPSGTKLHLRMDNEINSKVSSANDTFTATLAQPLVIEKTIVLPVGTVIEGRVIKVEPAAIGRKSGKMLVKFETLRLNGGVKREIEAGLINPLKADGSAKRTIFAVVGGTAAGAVIGAVFKGGAGSGIGAAVGAGAGTAAALAGKGKEVRIKTGEEFDIELKKSVNLPTEDY